ERSGVATPQACWRNLYKKDFECQPMGKTGEDQYGIEVPAKAVNDGFAYYLEAYDNNDNGPARSGAPELPNSVVVEDAPPPRLNAAVVAVARDVTPTGVGKAPSDALPGTDGNFAEGHTQPAAAQPKSHLLSYICMGGAGVAAATATGLFFHAQSLNNQANDASTPGSQKSSLQNQAKVEQTVSNVLLGLTLGFAVGAFAFWNF